jgi:hypothetical protein
MTKPSLEEQGVMLQTVTMLLLGLGATAAESAAPGSAAPGVRSDFSEALRIANNGYQRMVNDIRDYTCLLTRRERVNDRLFDHETMFLKVRHPRVEQGRTVTPFSVYIRFHSPEKVRGREVIYVAGKNNDHLIVRNGGTRFPFVTTSLPPDSPAAMRQNRYPITEVGVMNLTARLIEAGQGRMNCPDCTATIAPGARINDRLCTLIQVAHVVQRENQTFQTARIFVDEELQLPVRFASYDWPDDDAGKPVLLEEYTYTDIHLNVGLTDWDFDHRNEEYKFLKSFRP